MSESRTLLVLIGHGSPRPDWRRPLDELVESLSLTPGQVRLAFMEHCEPTLNSVAAEWLESGGERLVVLPLFISSGGHVQRDIVAQIEVAKATHSELDISLLPAFGELDVVRTALRAFITDIVEEG